ncbi:hypothetical protein EW146_g9461 [Bondarzewia mesenterica]|uniref:ATP-dependent DNA helicase n=1 Tax=Bondarzewia mesenterica TaxID=1095465 RepID=A0A4S4L6B5_9AGAM|nr:hypothetical protein EW146_g9461 [Bondarzewia mesenterica]
MSLILTIFGLVFISELISWVGHSVLLSFVWAAYERIVHASVVKRQREVKAEVLAKKTELMQTSAQDQFARWAKLRRSVDKGLAELEKLNGELSASKASFAVKFNSMVWVLTTGLQFVVGWWYRKTAVFYLPPAWLGPMTWWMSFPFAPADVTNSAQTQHDQTKFLNANLHVIMQRPVKTRSPVYLLAVIPHHVIQPRDATHRSRPQPHFSRQGYGPFLTSWRRSSSPTGSHFLSITLCHRMAILMMTLTKIFLNELNAMEASQFASSSKTPIVAPIARAGTKAGPLVLTRDDSDYDINFDIDERDLQTLDGLIEDAYLGKPAPVTRPPRSNGLSRAPSKGIHTTLFGGVAENLSSNRTGGSSKGPLQRSKSSGPQLKKTKMWDHTAFAKSGPRRRKSNKGKGEEPADGDEANEGEEGEKPEFKQFPATFVPAVGPPPAMKPQPDLLAAKHWLYPLNLPKRDYQYNIVKHCLFDNTLVALPTGLGKTFIAGVVMLNFYRWFPDGKIVFVAPTKPLVAQQIDACHQTCGIPGRDAAELTGNNPRAMRARAWEQKRVFYMTPQTLFNDLTRDNYDIRDIVLLVIDEAHKGTGDYAYATVVRTLMAKNPHFRVLALTATPGSNPEAVQAIVDSLHIGRIEIRDEESWDIRPYINKKKVEQHIIPMNEDIVKLRDLLAKVMKGPINSIANVGLLHGGHLDPIIFHPFRAQVAMQEINSRRDGHQLAWAFPTLKNIGALARAMGYLLEASPLMCYKSLQEIAGSGRDPGSGKSSKQSKLTNDPNFKTLLRELEAQKTTGFTVHPKMEKLKTLVVQHFGQRMGDEEGDGATADQGMCDDTRVMVFVTFREAVDEIVEFLNQESLLIRATKFIGQGVDKQGKRGFAQREQLDVIKRFKAGEFNVLVSTSIGEEGLDIGEIDMIVCYESQKTPIRMLQRVGRTGRKRDGFVHVLLAEGREELNWNKAQESYVEVQQSIVRGDQLEFYGDVERLLPDHIKPEPLEMVMDIEEYNRNVAEKANDSTLPRKGDKKRKRNDDMMRNIPVGASTGFVSVADLILTQGGKKRRMSSKAVTFDVAAGEDDDTDGEIEAGVFGPKRSTSTPATVPAKSLKPVGKAQRSKSMASKADKPKKAPSDSTRTKRTSRKSVPQQLTSSQFKATGADDSDDLDIEGGIFFSKTSRKTPPRSKSKSSPQFSSPEFALAKQYSASIIDICTSSEASPAGPDPLSSPSPPIELPRSVDTVIRSPQTPRKLLCAISSTSFPTPQRSLSFTSNRNVGNPDDQDRDWDQDQDLSWLLQDSVVQRNSSPSPTQGPMTNSDIEIVYDGAAEDMLGLSSSPVASQHSPSPVRANIGRDMPPPAFAPARRFLDTSSPKVPEPTFPVRPPGKNKRAIPADSSPFEMPPLSQKRLRHLREDSSPLSARPTKRKNIKVRDTAVAGKINPWIDVEANHSGDAVSGGSSDVEHMDLESEPDRRFIQGLPETQVSPSYDQLAVYQQSLFTQPPQDGKAPAFAKPPRRHGFTRGGASGSNFRARQRVLSSPPPDVSDEGADSYMLGSFVVDDDAEISYMPSSDA